MGLPVDLFFGKVLAEKPAIKCLLQATGRTANPKGLFVMHRKQVLSSALLSLLGIFVASTPAAQQTLDYTYDALGRLVTVNDTVNEDRNYYYDAAGNRISVTVGSSSNSSSSTSSSSSHPLICETPSWAPFQCNTTEPTSYGHWAYCNDYCAQN